MDSISEKLTRVEFTNLDKTLYPKVEITKKQVIEYYIKIAPKMLGLLVDRPLVLTRYPNGVQEQGFFEKDAPAGTPDWVKTFRSYSKSAKRTLNYIVCDNLDTLIWLANLAALEIHMTLSSIEAFEAPDLVVFDLDPKPPATYDDLVDVVLLLKEKLVALGLVSYGKTSGKKGFHVLIPIRKGYTFEQSRVFVQKVGDSLKKDTEKVVTERSKKETPGKVYIDYVQNSHGRTMVCPYSLRATMDATVSTPLPWGKVKKGLNPETLNLSSVVKLVGNPWHDLFRNRQKLEGV